MNDLSDPELEQEAQALLRPVREPPAAPPEVKARALARLMVALPVDGGGPGGSPPPASGGSGGALGRALTTRVPAWSLLASFAAGGALVAVALQRDPAPSLPAAATAAVTMVAPTSPPVAASTEAAPNAAAPAPLNTAPAAPAATPVRALGASSSHSQPATARPSEGSLEEERAMLDVARTALGRGDGANALQAAGAHARKFPRGALVEEREAMTIQALRLLHRDDEARARLDRFRGRFPTSLIRPALEADDAGSR